MTPRAGAPFADAQLPLVPVHQAEHHANGDRIRALLRRAVADNGLTMSALEWETGIDEKQIGRALKDDGGAHPPLALVAAIFRLDRLGTLICGLATMCGREAVVRKPDPEAENKALRAQLLAVRDDLNRLLGND